MCSSDLDVDISFLCSEFTNNARCDGSQVVLEPQGVRSILDNLSNRISFQEGGAFPKTIKNDKNIEMVTAWKSITSDPKFQVCFSLRTFGCIRRVFVNVAL